jgi:hypothetical protein
MDVAGSVGAGASLVSSQDFNGTKLKTGVVAQYPL